MGDFNLPLINWNCVTATDNTHQNFCEIIDTFNLIQLNFNPSRQNNNNILDLNLVTHPESYTDIEVKDTLINTDHFMFHFAYKSVITSNIELDNNSNTRYRYQFKNTNFDELEFYLTTADSVVEKCGNDINMAWFTWKTKVINILDELVPKSKIKNVKNSPW